MDDVRSRRAGARLAIEVKQSLEIVLQLAVSGMTGTGLHESLVITRNGAPVRGLSNNGTASGDSDLKTAKLPSVAVRISKKCWWP